MRQTRPKTEKKAEIAKVAEKAIGKAVKLPADAPSGIARKDVPQEIEVVPAMAGERVDAPPEMKHLAELVQEPGVISVAEPADPAVAEFNELRLNYAKVCNKMAENVLNGRVVDNSHIDILNALTEAVLATSTPTYVLKG
ncbi:hypothetical protein [Acetonema longum]|uniref:Uncharacterized protein n=1 Tax=Acetonema longum DSM 6540 TaxID=1009370 RepID=F7NK60_9FIRM|nr:hypothetical protein [Acetonema longum]EGO63501.1 hypothetical protein ALO_12366 [Acetonema longum DSM 6540]